jgi:hypothetical protein
VLDFDIETRKVGFHTGGRWNPDGCEPTAIAFSWVGSDDIYVKLLGVDDPKEMLLFFKDHYDEADLVTGHYIRRFDLPILNGALIEHGMTPLGEKLSSDTKNDLVDFAGLSKSQENLSAMLSLAEDKYHMSDHNWRLSTRLTPEGIERARRRVMDDVKQHKQLRAALLEAGILKAPRVWRP